MDYNSSTTFNEFNVVQYMAEMEEHMGRLMQDMARVRGDEYADISALPMEMLPQKNHFPPAMTIDPVDAPTIDTDNELITDKEVLYKKVVKSLDQAAARQ